MPAAKAPIRPTQFYVPPIIRPFPSGLPGAILGTQPTHLRAYWKCDETSGTTLADSSGLGNNIPITGSPTTGYVLNQPGQSGASIQWKGTDAYATFADGSGAILPTAMQSQDFTLLTLVKGTINGKVINISQSAGGNFMQITMDLNAGTQGYCSDDTGTTVVNTGLTGNAEDGAWHDIAFTRVGNVWTLYTDGVSIGSATAAPGGAITRNRVNLAAFNQSSGPVGFLTGYMQHVAIWNVGLSATELITIHNAAFPTQTYTQSFAATLSFAGAQTRVIAREMTATLAPAAALSKLIIDSGFAATLSFVGNLAASKTFLRAFTATLSTSAALARTVGKSFTATTSPTGSLVKKIIDSGFTATLSTTGALVKRIQDAGFTATLSFTGLLTTSKSFLKSFTATLSTTAALSRRTGKNLTATLSTSGALSRMTGKSFTATLSFVGAITRRTGKALTAAASFVGNLATSFIAGGGQVFTQSFTATLSFTGTLRTRANKVFAATLSPTGALTRRIAHNMAGSLSFVGNLTKRLPKAFTATLSFAGNLAVSKLFVRAFTATLAFSGNITKRTTKLFSATTTFTGAVTKAMRKTFTATTSFIGTFAKMFGVGEFWKFFAGSITGSAVTVQQTSGAFTMTPTVTVSALTISVASSDLKVVKTD
jgi:hypothetical protein